MRLKYKIPLILFAAYSILVGLLLTVTLVNSSSVLRVTQQEAVKNTAMWHSDVVKGFMESKFLQLEDIESTILAINDLDDKLKLPALEKLMRFIVEHPIISDAYVTFERGGYFSKEVTEPGHYFALDVFKPLKGGIEVYAEENDTVADDDDWYNIPKKTNKKHLVEPYKWTYPNEQQERLMITLSTPIISNGKFIGVVGVDVELDKLQKELFDGMIDPKTSAYPIFLSNSGLRVAHPKKDLLLVPIGNDLPAADQKKLQEAVRKGEDYFITKKSLQTGEISIISYVPMRVSGIDEPWSMGYVMPLSALQRDEIEVRNVTITIVLISAVLWAFFLVWLMSSVFGILTRTVAAIGEMTKGEGDLTIRLEEKSSDELGQMAKGLNALVEKLHSTIKTTQKEAHNLLGTSSSLFSIAHKLFQSSEATLEHSANVSKATAAASENAKSIANDAGKTSTGANKLAGTAEQFSMNMNSVAGAVEEMSASFAQITGSADESRKIAIEATEKSGEANEVMGKLGTAAKEIGHVTEMIKKIADKTNLLALNATIEAASAGESGKGFAVVAGEIKELANQSATSADDIANRIEGIQSGTSDAVEAISAVSAIISRINSSIDAIVNSVEEQTKASNEIANNAGQANAGARNVVKAISEITHIADVSAHNANNVANGAKDISESVGIMHEDAKKTNENSATLEKTADELKSMAENLDLILSKFKT